MRIIDFDQDEKPIEGKKSRPHHGHGRRRHWGYTKDGVRHIRPEMVDRKRPSQDRKVR